MGAIKKLDLKNIFLRCLVATLGGYFYAMLVAVLIAHLRAAPRAEATVSGIVVSFTIHAAIIIAAFAARSIFSLTMILGGSALIIIAVVFVTGGGDHV